jgi:DNA-binding CsgD family transcriptional regulator
MITEEMTRKMQQGVEALPPRCMMIFKLIREDGLKYKEVAEILNISVTTIDAQMAIAVKNYALPSTLKNPLRLQKLLLLKKIRKFFKVRLVEKGKKSVLCFGADCMPSENYIWKLFCPLHER